MLKQSHNNVGKEADPWGSCAVVTLCVHLLYWEGYHNNDRSLEFPEESYKIECSWRKALPGGDPADADAAKSETVLDVSVNAKARAYL